MKTLARRFCIRRKENADNDGDDDEAVGARLFPRDNDEHDSGDGDSEMMGNEKATTEPPSLSSLSFYSWRDSDSSSLVHLLRLSSISR